jgi:hypothetical protein
MALQRPKLPTQRSTMTSSSKNALQQQQDRMSATRLTDAKAKQALSLGYTPSKTPTAPQTTAPLSSGVGRETGNFSYQQAAKLRNSRMRKRL